MHRRIELLIFDSGTRYYIYYFLEASGTNCIRHRILLCIKSGCTQYVMCLNHTKPEFNKKCETGLGETLSVELAPFSIKVLIVAPGSFKTEGIYGQAFFTSNSIPAYDDLRNTTIRRFSAVPGTQKGDPNKAMEAVVDVVKGEGKAIGRPWPLYLALGDDADDGIRQKSTKLLRHVDEWGDVIKSVNFDT